MIYRDFQGEKISGLGLGMMRLPLVDGVDSHIDESLSQQMVDCAYENGVNYYDTAWGYHGGQSEIVAGHCLSHLDRKKFNLASKFPGYDNANFPKLREIFPKQLEKCGVDYFDFYLFHNVCESNIDDYLDPKWGVRDYLVSERDRGRIRHLGFSAHGAIPVIKRFLDAYADCVEFCQLQINYMDWDFQDARGKVELLREYGIPVWVMEPVRGGKLAHVPEPLERRMKELRPDETVPGWAFRFIQAIPGTVVTLSGMSDMEQLQANIRTWEEDKPLNEEEFDTVVRLASNWAHGGDLPCTGCRYCTGHCPMGLPIPDIIALYNERILTGESDFIASMGMDAIAPDKRPNNCIGCRSCEQVCPQQIKISEMMSKFSQMLGL